MGSEAVATATGEEGSGSAAADLGREAVAMATEEEGSGSACHVARTPNSKNEIENYSLNNIASKKLPDPDHVPPDSSLCPLIYQC